MLDNETLHDLLYFISETECIDDEDYATVSRLKEELEKELEERENEHRLREV